MMKVIPVDMFWRGVDYKQGEMIDVKDDSFRKAIDAYLKAEEDSRQHTNDSLDVPSQQEPEEAAPRARKPAAKD